MRKQLQKTVLLCMLLMAYIVQAQNLTVTVNTTTVSAQPSLQAAITASGVALGSITSLEVTAGDFTTADWNYLKNNRSNITAITSFTITNSITTVADIPDTSPSPFNSYFNPSTIETIIVNKVDAIGDGAFYLSEKLTTVSFPAATSIGEEAFITNSVLTSISFPMVTSIGDGAFGDCKGLTSVSFPKAVSIGDAAFSGCINLTSASFPSAITSIGEFIFSNCTDLTQLALGATPPLNVNISSNAFSNIPRSVRSLLFVDANNTPLTGTALTNAQSAYDGAEGATNDNLWYGWVVSQLKVTVNGVTPQKVGTSLAAALTGVSLSTITSLEVTEGSFTTADWNYLKNNRNSFTAMTDFTIATSITAVADIPNTTGGNPYFNPNTIENITVNKLVSIGYRAFYYCSSLTSVSLPEATSIGNGVFTYCAALTSVSLPMATSIGDSAFDYCTSLTSVSLPMATSIGNNAFYNCSGLTSVLLPEATSIGEQTFGACSSLTSVSFPKVTSTGAFAFSSCASLTSVSLPMATSIGNSAFYYCSSLTSVSLPEATSIGNQAFSGCSSLTSVSFPKVESIGDFAFDYCTSLTSISFPKVESIGDSAFRNCSNLTQLALSATLPTSVGSNAFLNTPTPRSLLFIDATSNAPLTGIALTNAQSAYDGNHAPTNDNLWYGWKTNATLLKVTVNGVTPQKVGTSLAAALSGTDLSTITSLEVTEGSFTTADWNYLKNNQNSFTAMTDFTIATSITAVADIPNTTILAPYFKDDTIENITVNKVGSIGELAFYYHTRLTSISLPEATSIGYGAFAFCTSLTSVSLPEATSIGEQMFSNCTSLTSVSLPKVTSIGNLAFDNCSNLTRLDLGATPPTVVDPNAFSNTPTNRSLLYMSPSNTPLTNIALSNARLAYILDASDGNNSDNRWYGWKTNTAFYPLTTTATNGTVTATKQYAKAGETIGFTLSPNAGYQLKTNGLKVYQTGTPATTVAVTSNSFTMPNYYVTISAEFLKTATINFANINKTYGDASFTLTATSDSAGAISYSVVSGTGVSLSGANNSTVNITGAGVVTIRATQLETATHAQATKDITLTIAKKELTVTAADKTKAYNNAVFPATGYSVSYTGFVNNDTASVLGGSLVYGGTSKTAKNVGAYTIVPSGLTSNSYTFNYVAGSLKITKATLTGITFSDATFAYDGTEKSLAITGDVPAGTSVSYTGNNQTDVGVYTVTANIAGGTNYNNASLTANLSVTKASITGITFSDATFAYDGTEKSLAITGNLPAGTSVSYTGNANTNGGTYQVTANIAGGTNYKDTSLTANLTITKLPITGITFSDATVVNDGSPKSLAITGNLPAGASVSYTGNNQTDTGVYTVTANIAGGTNYKDLTLTATLTVKKPKKDITGISFSDATFTYNGTEKSIAIVGDLPAGTSVSYTGSANTNAGTYQAVATINGGDDYKDLTLTATVTIKKAPQTITWGKSTTQCQKIVLQAVTSSGLPVNFTSGNTNVDIQENVLTILTNQVSEVMVSANQAGSANYLPADSVEKAFFTGTNSLIKKMSPTILGFDNSSELYSNWQWYKNDTKIAGATKQYYNESSALQGDFYVTYQDNKGNSYQSCPLAVNVTNSNYGLRLYPNPVMANATYVLKNFYNENALVGAKIQVFNLLGQKVGEVNQVSPKTTLNAPKARGMYIVILQLANGVKESINLSVQ